MTQQKQQIDLKPLLKPLLKEIVKEVILESGFLSKIITEVISGINNSKLVESQNIISKPNKSITFEDQELNEQRMLLKEEYEKEKRERLQNAQKIIESTGLPKVFENLKIEEKFINNVSENIKQDNDKQVKKPIIKENKQEKAYGALKDLDPNDPGVNINGILNIIGGKKTWAKHLDS